MTDQIRIAELADVEHVSELFNQYRMFYNEPSDLEGAGQYIRNRMQHNESIILVAERNTGSEVLESMNGKEHRIDQALTGFVQLYPTFSSLSMRSNWILNDLYVHPEYRQQGIARKLLQASRALAKERGVVALSLSTGVSNKQAQALYESEGYVLDTYFLYYDLNV
ncbi:acetyltransferase [Paenibacillus sp. Root52]|uniref:Ribosomal protein S18 acetylase RimI-like enzyme n=1 Tax=Paenibacillus amylolyticus TaxID=1451 RepID=A0AAP5LPE9_PAEAM|nr:MULTISPECIES: GNAT family N-acetyltransferase [Paenibacillus]KQY83033.1 acetyltransferase [Paenibacillus sp. Root52]MDR6722419.1 ribosomal protein S18 acetylase RimI-like enzyme [Paenibacillus amylolyticus]